MFLVRLGLGVFVFVAVSLYGVVIALLCRDQRFVARDYAHLLAHWKDPAFGIYISNHQNLAAPWGGSRTRKLQSVNQLTH